MLLIAARNGGKHEIEEACRIVAEHYYQDRGEWCYQAFAWINRTLFDDGLPLPLIVLGLTAHGACLAWTRSSKIVKPDQTSAEPDKPPVILMHPSLWGGTERDDPWSIPPDLLGPRWALDVLIHECIHVSVNYQLGGRSKGDSSHNNPEWIAEVNRIAPLIGLPDVRAAMSKPKREGKKIVRRCDGNIPFEAASRFPHPVRQLRGQLNYYRDRSSLPFERNGQLEVTETGAVK